MPNVTIYLPADLARAVADAGLPVSHVCQAALRRALGRAWGAPQVRPERRPGVSVTRAQAKNPQKG